MVLRCALLVVLVLTCLQSFTTAHHGVGPGICCFNYLRYKIKVKVITAYQKTGIECTMPGIIFTLKNGKRVCTDPGVEWVQSHMMKIDQRRF